MRDWGQRERDALDRHITGNYGEDQLLQETIMDSSIDMTNATPKKHSVRFDTDDANDPVASIYVSRWWVQQHGGCPNGVRVTIEPIEN